MSTTRVLDARTRTITSTDLAWRPPQVEPGDLLPEEVTATYYRAAAYGVVSGRNPGEVEGMTRSTWVVTVHVLGRLAGKTGLPIGKLVSSWYVHRPGDDPADAGMPPWLLAWVEAYHPDRGHPDNDPDGSYL